MRQLVRHLPRDLGADARRIERERITPQGLQPFADGGVVQIGQRDAVRSRVWEGRLSGTAATEFSVQLNHMADIDDHQERRTPFACRQRVGIAFCLSASAQQRVIEAFGVYAGAHLLRF